MSHKGPKVIKGPIYDEAQRMFLALNQRRSHGKGANYEDHQRVTLCHLYWLYGRIPTSPHDAGPGADADAGSDDCADVPQSSRCDGR
jgi:hypothetical protein